MDSYRPYRPEIWTLQWGLRIFFLYVYDCDTVVQHNKFCNFLCIMICGYSRPAEYALALRVESPLWFRRPWGQRRSSWSGELRGGGYMIDEWHCKTWLSLTLCVWYLTSYVQLKMTVTGSNTHSFSSINYIMTSCRPSQRSTVPLGRKLWTPLPSYPLGPIESHPTSHVMADWLMFLLNDYNSKCYLSCTWGI